MPPTSSSLTARNQVMTRRGLCNTFDDPFPQRMYPWLTSNDRTHAMWKRDDSAAGQEPWLIVIAVFGGLVVCGMIGLAYWMCYKARGRPVVGSGRAVRGAGGPGVGGACAGGC